jgi:hypothetical protein
LNSQQLNLHSQLLNSQQLNRLQRNSQQLNSLLLHSQQLNSLQLLSLQLHNPHNLLLHKPHSLMLLHLLPRMNPRLLLQHIRLSRFLLPLRSWQQHLKCPRLSPCQLLVHHIQINQLGLLQLEMNR